MDSARQLRQHAFIATQIYPLIIVCCASSFFWFSANTEFSKHLTLIALVIILVSRILIEVLTLPFADTGANLEKQEFATGGRNLQAWSNGVGQEWASSFRAFALSNALDLKWWNNPQQIISTACGAGDTEATKTLLETTQLIDWQALGSWESLQPTGTYSTGLIREVGAPAVASNIRALGMANVRFFHLRCYDTGGEPMFGGATGSRLPSTTLQPPTDIVQNIESVRRDCSEAGKTLDPIILYIQLHNLSQEAEKALASALNKLPIQTAATSTSIATTSMSSLIDKVVVFFDRVPSDLTLQAKSSGVAGRTADATLRLLQTEADLKDVEAYTVKETASISGNNKLTAIIPDDSNILNQNFYRRAQLLGVNFVLFHTSQPIQRNGFDGGKGMLTAPPGFNTNTVSEMRPITDSTAGTECRSMSDYVQNWNFYNYGWLLKPSIITPDGELYSGKTLQPRTFVKKST